MTLPFSGVVVGFGLGFTFRRCEGGASSVVADVRPDDQGQDHEGRKYKLQHRETENPRSFTVKGM